MADSLIKAKKFLKESHEALVKDRFDAEDGCWEMKAAYNLAMSAEFVMKGLLYGEGIMPAKMHQHLMLVAACQYYHIKIPLEFDSEAELLKDFESSSRYDSDFELDAEEFEYVYGIVSRFVNFTWNRVVPVIVLELQKYTPPSVVNADMSMRTFKEHIKFLPKVTFKECVDAQELWRRVKSKNNQRRR